MTPEVVDAYGPSSYPYVSGSLSSSRPASTESKATTTSACFFEVPHANQNDDLMVRRFSLRSLIWSGGGTPNLMSCSPANCMLHLRRDEMRANSLHGMNGSFRRRKAACLICSIYSPSSTLSLRPRAALEHLCKNALQLPFPFLTSGDLKLS